ncbi:uncharacterized protein [Haliotis asinina]|uniref:uncharacterized protein n=1 Tax=Haliotis asinina TaxID=109174 RepID=UPI0035326156
MGLHVSGPLLCLAVITLLLSGGLARRKVSQVILEKMMTVNARRIGEIQAKHAQEIEKFKRALNNRIEERVKYLFRKWAGMPEIPIYCPYPVLSDKLLEVACKGPFTEGQTCKLKCPMSIPLRGSTNITCTRSANDYTGYWAAVEGEEPKCDGPCAVRHQHYLDVEQHLLGSSEPQCETDGTYKPKQCRGAGCYCVDSDGNDLGYFTNYAAGTDNMDCTCARDKAAYLKTGLIGKLFFCDNKGSYSKKQCTGSVCFCADVNGKMLGNSQTVNIGEMDKLQC